MWLNLFWLVIPAVYAIILFNRLVRHRNRVKEGWSGIDVQLKRRHDLVPSLVTVVRGYAGHEQRVLEEVTMARTRGMEETEVTGAVTAEGGLSRALRRVLALVESYPDLKADTNFLDLQKNLVEIEDNLQYARRYYNGTVRDYNIAVESFPSNLVARTAGFKPADFFTIELAVEREAPPVQLSSGGGDP